jgi:hypothetical protein
MHASELEIGDIIIEGRSEIKVVQLDKTICKGKVHVNGKDCYEHFALVKVHPTKRYDPNFDETKSKDGVYEIPVGTPSNVHVPNDFYTKTPTLV